MTYPSAEVSGKTILRHVVLPGRIRLLTWEAGQVDNLNIRLGYAIYRKGHKDPVFQGYIHCDRTQMRTDAAILEVLGLILLSAWNVTMYSHDMEEFATEYTEDQVDWLNSQEVIDLFAILDTYEEEILDDLEEDQRQFYWHNDRLFSKSSARPVIEDVSVN